MGLAVIAMPLTKPPRIAISGMIAIPIPASTI
jgi:hypothetical protein